MSEQTNQLTPIQALDLLASTLDKVAFTGPDRRVLNAAFAVLLPLVQPTKDQEPKAG